MPEIIGNNKGLTLVEIMVSLAVLGIIIVPITSLFLFSVKTNKISEEQLIAQSLAQQYIEDLKSSNNVALKTKLPKDYYFLIEITPDNNYKISSEGSNDSIITVGSINLQAVNLYIKVKYENDNYIYQLADSQESLMSNPLEHTSKNSEIINISYSDNYWLFNLDVHIGKIADEEENDLIEIISSVKLN